MTKFSFKKGVLEGWFAERGDDGLYGNVKTESGEEVWIDRVDCGSYWDITEINRQTGEVSKYTVSK